MDKIFNPNQRKWIAPPVSLGKCMDEMKRLVRLQKDHLLVIDPIPRLEGGESSSTNGPSSYGYEPDFMRSEAMKYEGEESNIETESERLAEEIERKNRDKWSEDDAVCAAAVAAVGGGDFFLFKKKKGEKKGKGQRGRRPKDVEELVEEGDDEEEEDEEDEDDDIEEYDTSSLKKEEEMDKEKLVDASMYEHYNYQESRRNSLNFDKDAHLQNMMTVDEQEFLHTREIIPGVLNESDDDNDWLDIDNDMDNYTGFTQKIVDSKFKLDIENMVSIDSDVSDPEGEQVDSSDEEETKEENPDNEQEPVEQVDDGQIPCCSKSVPVEQSSAPLQSSPSKKGSEKKKGKKEFIDLSKIKQEVQDELAPSDPQPVNLDYDFNTATNDISGSKPADKKVEPVQDATADFKRFTDWVFNKNNKRDKEEKLSARPALMTKTVLPDEFVKDLQSTTSANMCSVKGEVFQDEPVMQSSSMPLLAPPTNIQARTTLQSLAIFLTHGEDPSVFPWKSINVQQQMNDDFVNHQFLKRMEQQKLDVVNPAMKDELVNKQDDFLVQILIYQNTDPDDVLPDEVKMYIEPKLAYELNMLGSQTVKDLMSAFHCENDYVSLKDIPHPDNYKEEPANFAKSHFPSAMILIHDTIYADPNSEVDYVKIINEWAEKKPDKYIGPFQKGDWNTKLCDLTLSFGYPYVYIHLGGCEHIYVFTKSRLLNVEDDHLIKSYPKIVGMTRYKNVYCRVDNEYLARWAVLDYKEFPENPMLLCTECVRMYCYDKQKKKRGNFKLYPFTQLANIL